MQKTNTPILVVQSGSGVSPLKQRRDDSATIVLGDLLHELREERNEVLTA